MLVLAFLIYHSLQNFPVNSKNIFYSPRPIPNKFSLLLPSSRDKLNPILPECSSAHGRGKQARCVSKTQVSQRVLSRPFRASVVRWIRKGNTRSNQTHFMIEFQAGEEESDSHLRGKREKKIWERETRGVWRSAATVSVCFNVNWTVCSSCCCCTPRLLRPLRHYGFSASRTFRDYFSFCGKNTVNHIWPFTNLNGKFERMKIYENVELKIVLWLFTNWIEFFFLIYDKILNSIFLAY